MTSLAGRAGCLFLCLATLAWYACTHWQLRLDAGQADDFVDVLWFMEVFLSRQHWLDQLASLTLPNHEHITLFNHLVFVLHYAVFGQVQFMHYTLAGHVIVLLTCVTLARWLAERMDRWLAITIAMTVYVNLFYWDSMAWAITAISNQSVILFALLAAWSFHRQPQAIGWPLVWALAATASQFNGLTVLFALALANVLYAWLHHEPISWRQTGIWLSCGTVLFVGYFVASNPLDPGSSLVRHAMATEPALVDEYRRFVYNSSEMPALPELLLQIIGNSPQAILSSIGALMLPDAHAQAAVALGLLMLLVAALACWRQRQQIDRFWLVAILFCLASIGMVAVVRGSYIGAAVGMTSRYRMYSFLMLLLVLQPFLATRWRPAAITVLLLCGMATQLASTQVLPAYRLNREQVAVSYHRWLVDGGLGRTEMIFYPHNQDRRLINAVKGGYYHPYSAVHKRHKPLAIRSTSAATCTTALSGHTAASTVQAYTKKPAALATELTWQDALPWPPQRVLLCSGQGGIEILLGPDNIITEANTYRLHPLMLLKRDVPPGHYTVLLYNDGATGTYTSDIVIR